MKLFHEHNAASDVIMVWWGIMSATLWIFLKILEPDLQIHIFERRDAVGYESSDALNNAGTGHSALCELNYTPYKDGKLDSSKADKIVEMFEQSKQFRSHLVQKWYFPHGNDFINWVPHMSLVFGDDDVKFLRDRYETMIQNPLFADMVYSEDIVTLQKRFPLMMDWRDFDQKVAATRHELGTDINFGQLTRDMFDYLNNDPHVHIHLDQEIVDLKHLEDKKHREVTIKDLSSAGNKKREMTAEYVFLGSGGMAIPLLKKSGIPAGNNYAWFPVDGQRLICNNPEIVNQHHGKVYGKAGVWAPPMSVPHLDTRIIDGRRSLLFWPYAGFTTKFLKQGHRSDMFRSIHLRNIIPLIQVGLKNRPLTKYLIWQILQKKDDRMVSLKEYFPKAKNEDRYREHAGKRVQIIKNDKDKWWVLQFGTEVVISEDKSLSALLGASPWASTSVSIILELLEMSFPEQMKSDKRITKLQELIPSYGTQLRDDPELAKKIRTHTSKILGLSKAEFEKKVYGAYE